MAQLVVAAAHAVGVDGNDELALAGAGIAEGSAILLGISHGNGARGRHGHVPFDVRNLLDRGRAALLLRHLGDVLDGGLVIDRGHNRALAIKLLQGFERLDDGQRAGIAHGIDFNLGRHSISFRINRFRTVQSSINVSLTDNVDGRTAWHRLAHATDNGGDTPLGIQTARKLIHIRRGRRNKQTA